jgi:flagellar hook assembly protein FlgD
MGVFLPPWNKTKVKEKEAKREDKIYPNPSTNAAEITFSLANTEEIGIVIYDNSGRAIQTLHQGLLEAGEHTFSWVCSNVSAGKYICNIRGNSVFRSMKVMVIK